MNFMKLLRVIKAYLYVSAWSLFFLNPLRAGFSVTTIVEGDRVISGFINETNTITMTVSFTGADEAAYEGGDIRLYVAWVENGASDPDVQSNGVYFSGKLTGITNGSAEIEVLHTDLQNNNQKLKVVETFDRAQTTREIKLVYSTLAEQFGDNGSITRKHSIKESASSAVSSTKPSKGSRKVISEETQVANRFKKLAGIIK